MYICPHMALKLTTYYKGSDIPDLPGNNFFHSKELFLLYEATPSYTPIYIVATEEQKTLAKILVVIRKNTSLIPFSILNRCDVYGTGEYLDDTIDKETLFGEMLSHYTKEIFREASIIEFRNLNNSLFGYKHFRGNHYFPVNWLRVHNSLHSVKSVDERFTASRIRQIKKGLKNGAEVYEAQNKAEIQAFTKVMRRIYSARIRRYFPGFEFFEHIDSTLLSAKIGKIFVVRYKEKIIGGSVLIFSEDTAYLWFSGGMRKTYASLYPGVLSVWAAMQYAHENKYRHLEFMDVGLPFRKHGYRDLVLQFGGKQSSSRRWFRVRWKWLNKVLCKIYV